MIKSLVLLSSGRLKGSAVLIALFAGTLLTALLALMALSNQGILGKIRSNNDQALARHAAQSGIEDGRFRYRKALEKDQKDKLYDINRDKIYQGEASYQLSIKIAPPSAGDNFGKSDFIDNPDLAVAQGALALEKDQQLNIDLNFFYKTLKQKERPVKIEVKFSDLFERQTNGLKKSSESSEITYELIDRHSDKKISSGDFNSFKNHVFVIDNLSECGQAGIGCELRIKSAGSGITFMKMQSRTGSGIIKPTGEIPGTVIIESTGYYNHSKITQQAKYDSLGGKYLGIFSSVVD